ncbi:uncharacterized protein LOC115228473, partial [Argonauta hians]
RFNTWTHSRKSSLKGKRQNKVNSHKMSRFLFFGLFIIGALLLVSIETGAMSTELRKHLNVIKKAQNHVQSGRAVRETRREEDGDDEEEDYEEGGFGSSSWGSREDAEMFLSIFDLNRDGKLSKDELWGFYEAVSYSDKDITKRLKSFSAVDTNADTFFTVDEIMAAMQLSLL